MSLLLLASFQAAALALAILLLERLAGRWLTPGVRLALWALVPMRLLLVIPISDPFGADRPSWWTWEGATPVATSLETQLPDELSAAAAGSTPPREAATSSPLMHRTTRGENEVRETEVSATTEARAERTPTPASPVTPLGPALADPSAPTVAPVAPTAPTALVPDDHREGIAKDAAGIHSLWWLLWALGFSFVLVRTTRAELHLRRHLRRASLNTSPSLQALVDACAQQLGLRHPVPVRLVEGIPSPAAHGWHRGQLLLPLDLEQTLDEEELRFVLLHELAHLRHRDGLQNLLLAVLGAVHWFNPFVALAHHRLRDERELLRDQEALAALPHVSARRCAATLVKLLPRQQPAEPRASLSALLPHHRTTRRRIAMIIHPWQPKRLQLLPGVACLLLLGWAGLTQTQAQSGPASPSYPSTGGPGVGPAGPVGSRGPAARPQMQVRVTRQTPEPAWLAPTLARLQQHTLQWQSPIELDGLAQLIEGITELEVRIEDDLFHEFEEFSAMRVPVTIDRALDLLCEVHPMRWTIEDGGISLEYLYEEPDNIELRFYDVQSLIGSDHERGEHLKDVLHELTDHGDVWDWNGVGMRLWNGQLLVQQSASVHARVENVLNMLLERRSPAITGAPKEHLAVFLQRVSVEEGTSIDEFLGERFATVGIPLVIHPDYAGMEFEFPSDNVPFQAVLAEVLEHTGGHFTYHDGVVYYGDRVPMTTACYEIADLVQPTSSEMESWFEDEVPDPEWMHEVENEIRADKSGHLMDLLFEMVDPNIWEIDGPSMLIWDDLLLITQSNHAHGKITSFLETARRAVRR